MIVKRNNIKNPVYVGDTKGDAVAAKEASIPFIFVHMALEMLMKKIICLRLMT